MAHAQPRSPMRGRALIHFTPVQHPLADSEGRPSMAGIYSEHPMIDYGLRIAALILFVLAAIPVPSRFGLVPAGLACWVLSTLI